MLVRSAAGPPIRGPVPTITTAPLPPRPIDKGLPGLLAHVVVSKFADHIPLYRQHGMLARHGMDVPRSTLGGWVAAADLLKPLVGRMAELVRQSRVIQTDDTPGPGVGAWLPPDADWPLVGVPRRRGPPARCVRLHPRPTPAPARGPGWAGTIWGTGALTRDTEAGVPEHWQSRERALRAIAVGRKNDLFAGSDSGGRSAAVLYSVTGTCRRLGLDPFVYLRDVFDRVQALSADRLDEALPDRRVTGRTAIPM